MRRHRSAWSVSAFGHRLFYALILAALVSAPATAACEGADGGESVVTGINAGETLILEDGRAVRLIGVLGPKRARRGPASEARDKMEKAIAELTLGKKIALHLGERKRDRYGRVLAQVKVTGGDGKPVWVQERLVAAGLARVISFKRNRLCVKALLAIEAKAREARRGFWESGFFAIRSAKAEDLLSRLARSYEIVEGHVQDVAQIRGKTYINFGRNWRRDFTAFIPSRSAELFEARDARDGPSSELTALKGQRIRVRGWLKNYNGPSITVTHPEQIEAPGGDAKAAMR